MCLKRQTSAACVWGSYVSCVLLGLINGLGKTGGRKRVLFFPPVLCETSASSSKRLQHPLETLPKFTRCSWSLGSSNVLSLSLQLKVVKPSCCSQPYPLLASHLFHYPCSQFSMLNCPILLIGTDWYLRTSLFMNLGISWYYFVNKGLQVNCLIKGSAFDTYCQILSRSLDSIIVLRVCFKNSYTLPLTLKLTLKKKKINRAL